MSTIKIILALTIHNSWVMHDIRNAFLHGDLEKEVYMEVSLSIQVEVPNNVVCTLKKAVMVSNNAREHYLVDS